MSQPTQTIAAYGSKVTPFRAIAADADFIAVTPAGFGATGPKFQATVGQFIPAVAATPGTPAVPQRSGPNLPDYVPAVPATPGTAEVPASFIPHRQEQIELTQAEWDNWDKSTTDEVYILAIVGTRLGLNLHA